MYVGRGVGSVREEKTQIEKNDSQAMCTYLQSEQCHSIDPLNLLNTSQGMFSHFL